MIPAIGVWLVAAQPAAAQRVVNITAGSEQGWLPAEEQERNALSAAEAFFAALERGEFSKARAMLSEGTKALIPDDQFASQNREFRAVAGPLVRRAYNRVTWTKDSPTAPSPGTYVALDVVAEYENVDRYCGYIVLYQSDPALPFQVSRIERNFISNADADAVKPPARLDELWRELVANCPNYKPLELPEADSSTIGYDSVAAALADLRTREDLIVQQQDGWTVVIDDADRTVWSFAPVGYPAYPAVVRRRVIASDGRTSIAMDVRCEASKQACDDLVRTFTEMNAALPR